MFNTFANKELQRAEHRGDLEYAYGLARAHNRAIVDFCSVDRRLLPVGYVPLADCERATEVHATVRRRLCAIDESLSAAVEFAEEAEVRGGVHRRELVVPGGRRPKDAETLTEEAAVGEGRDRERVAGP